jgi:hypothetical protein
MGERGGGVTDGLMPPLLTCRPWSAVYDNLIRMNILLSTYD